MLAAGIVTTDVQPLLSESTGDVLFIDMTEAKTLSLLPDESLPFIDMVLASSFCAEMLSLIPEQYYDLASTALLHELQSVESRGEYITTELYGLLRDQTPFISEECLDYINSKI